MTQAPLFASPKDEDEPRRRRRKDRPRSRAGTGRHRDAEFEEIPKLLHEQLLVPPTGEALDPASRNFVDLMKTSEKARQPAADNAKPAPRPVPDARTVVKEAAENFGRAGNMGHLSEGALREQLGSVVTLCEQLLRERTDREKSDRQRADREREERELAECQRLDRERALTERIERAEREAAAARSEVRAAAATSPHRGTSGGVMRPLPMLVSSTQDSASRGDPRARSLRRATPDTERGLECASELVPYSPGPVSVRGARARPAPIQVPRGPGTSTPAGLRSPVSPALALARRSAPKFPADLDGLPSPFAPKNARGMALPRRGLSAGLPGWWPQAAQLPAAQLMGVSAGGMGGIGIRGGLNLQGNWPAHTGAGRDAFSLDSA